MGNFTSDNTKGSILSNHENIIPRMHGINLKEYFSMINHKAKAYKNENQSNKLNVSISLDKKDFNSTSVKKFSSLDDVEFINWKDFLNNYLLKQSKKGFDWASDLLE